MRGAVSCFACPLGSCFGGRQEPAGSVTGYRAWRLEECSGQQKLVRAIRVTQLPLLSKYCCASTAVRPLGQVALAAEGSTSTEEKSPKRKLLGAEKPLTSDLSLPVRVGIPAPGRTPSTVSDVAIPAGVSV